MEVNFLACTLINIMMIPISILCLLYRSFVIMYLKCKYKDVFAKLMDGADACLEYADIPEAVNIPMFLIEIESDKYDSEGRDRTLLTTVREEMFKFIQFNDSVEKMTYTRHRELGYAFWKKGVGFKIEDYIQRWELQEGETIDQFCSDISTKPLPRNGKAIWKMYIIDKAVGDYQNGNYRKFYLIFTFHHSLGDGLSVQRMFAGNLLKRIEKEDQKPVVAPNPSSGFQIAMSFWKWPQTLRKLRSFRFYTSPIHPESLSGDKIISFYLDERQILSKVKTIKNAFPGTKFLDVIHAALSVSLYQFITKFKPNEKIPDYIYMGDACAPPGTTFNQIVNEYEMKNRSTMDLLYIKLVSPEIPTKEKIEFVRKDSSEIRPSELQFQCIQKMILDGIGTYAPLGCVKTARVNRLEVGVSNLVNQESYNCYGRKMTHMSLVPSNCLNTGLCFGIYSYEDQLNIGFYTDKAIVKNEAQAKEIINGLIGEIEKMYESVIDKNK